jgi:nitrate reductase gamma subunit
MGAPDKPSLSGAPPRHLTVRVRSWSTIGGFVLLWHRTVQCYTGQSSAPSDFPALTLLRTIHCCRGFCSRPLAQIVVAPLNHRTVRWHTGQSGEL